MMFKFIHSLVCFLYVGQIFSKEFFRVRSRDVDEFEAPLHASINGHLEADRDGIRGNEEMIGAETYVNARFVEMLRVKNGGRWGTWGPAKFCQNGSFAVGYDMKIEPKQRVDNTALNAIKLICEDRDGNVTGSVTSTEGPWGSWVGQTKCRNRDYFISFDLQVQEYRGKWKDDTAANYVKFKCRCHHGRTYEIVKPPGHGLWGTWGPWSNQCPNRTAVCGIQTKVEKERGKFRDDTALNDVRFFCCNL